MIEQAKASKKDGQDDGFSVTSTSEENDETEEFFSFVGILAERRVGETTMYLVEWEDYPLSKATWEPPEHFEQGTFSEWEEFKKQSGRRTAPGFKIADWKKAIHDEVSLKRARHNARNAKRASLGRPSTPFQNFGADYLEVIEESLEDFEEPDDAATVTHGAKPASDAGTYEPQESAPMDCSHGPETSVAIGHEANPATVVQSCSQGESPDMSALHPSSGKKTPTAQTLPVDLPRRPSSTREKAISPSPLPTRQRASRTVASTTTVARSKQPPPASKDPYAGANVFAGGRVRKDRSTILEAVADTTREPKMLKLRHQNIVRKRLRDREGIVAPALPPNRLVALGSSATSLVRSDSAANPRPDTSATADDYDGDDVLWDNPSPLETATDLPQKPESADAAPSQLSAEPLGLSETQTGENTRKRKRSVRWDDIVTVVEAPDARGEGLLSCQDPWPRGRADNSVGVASHPPFASPETVHSGDSHGGLETQTISIPSQIGTGQEDLTVLPFSGLPQAQGLPWLQHFSSQTRMIFTHTCTTHDFSSQIELQEKYLCQGFISNPTGEERYEAIARRLRSGCLGLLCHNGEYCVLIFPAEGGVESGQPGEDTCASLLRYSIIKPSICLEPSMLAPLTFEDSGVGSETSSLQDVPVFDTFFDFKYDQLLPPSARRESRHNFFLAFPPSARQEAYLVSQWLHYCEADCDVKSSLHPGSWSSFLKVDHGTLILHEDATWTVRLFPNFANLLRAPSGDFSFFLFKKAEPLLHVPPPQDSSHLSVGASKQLSPIFRPGTAYLVTPSFLLSQPEQAYVFVKWFWQNYSRNSQTYRRGKLVVCSDVEDWTLNLAVQASRRKDERKDVDEEMQNHGPSAKSVENIIKTWCLLRNLVADSTDETDGFVVFAPEVIHSSDEQSLVNWFGWWAIVNMDQFRKFAVIGSGSQHSSRLTVSIQPPSYHEAGTMAPQATPGNQTDVAVHQSQGAAWQLVYNDGGATLCDYLVQIDEALRQEEFRPLALYKYAISYWDPDMFFHLQDYKSAFKSFREWLNYFSGLVKVDESRRMGWRGHINSYAGFFYTIKGAWDRTKYFQGVKPVRRPWIAILRPTNPHRRPWSTAELFIWDCKAWAQHPGESAVHLSDLICAQRELVKLIQEESQMASELPLQRVWLGGSTAGCEADRFSEPLDIVLSWLANLPSNIRDLVPAPENKIPERNWKVVHPGRAPGKAVDATVPVPTDVQSPGPKSIVFLPPRVEGEARRTECRNRLYDWTERKRKSSKPVSSTAFTFEPTMRWYTEQVQKGHGLHHIDVSPWNATFTRHKIPDPKDVSDQS